MVNPVGRPPIPVENKKEHVRIAVRPQARDTFKVLSERAGMDMIDYIDIVAKQLRRSPRRQMMVRREK